MPYSHPASRKRRWKTGFRLIGFGVMIYGGYLLYLFYPRLPEIVEFIQAMMKS